MALLIQISANTGPAECCLGVVKMMRQIESDARSQGLTLDLVSEVEGREKGTLQSVLLALDGPESDCASFAAATEGTVLWVCQSPFRPNHKRKNWYLDVSSFNDVSLDVGGEVIVETMRASGPGGQHVNKTESAVRVTHVQTGISVKIAGSRSQRQNKDNAMRVLGLKLREVENSQRAESMQQKRDRHTSKASGIVKRRFVGDKFIET